MLITLAVVTNRNGKQTVAGGPNLQTGIPYIAAQTISGQANTSKKKV